jgi:competence protein ComFC
MNFLHLLFPAPCVLCKRPVGIVCLDCQPDFAIRLSMYSSSALPIYIASQDNEALISRLLFAWKYQRYLGAGSMLQSLWSDAFTRVMTTTEKVTLVPIPIHWFKRWQRGFNQAEELAHLLVNTWPVEMRPLLKRSRYTATQVGLNKGQRQLNLQAAFAVDNEIASLLAQDNLILLIDDIVTSGTTLVECAAVLRQAGFHHILALVLHRGTRSAL